VTALQKLIIESQMNQLNVQLINMSYVSRSGLTDVARHNSNRISIQEDCFCLAVSKQFSGIEHFVHCLVLRLY